MTAVLRAAIIGTGFVGRITSTRSGAPATPMSWPSAERIPRDGGRPTWGCHLRRRIRSLLEDPQIDVVHICTPNATHTELALQALRAGRHVVVEKPMALTRADAQTLAAIAPVTCRRRLHLSRLSHGAAGARHGGAGDIGDVRLVHGAYLQDWLALPTDYNWRLEEAVSGPARAVADIGTHWFDTVEFVTGRRVSEVFAELRDVPAFTAAATGRQRRLRGGHRRARDRDDHLGGRGDRPLPLRGRVAGISRDQPGQPGPEGRVRLEVGGSRARSRGLRRRPSRCGSATRAETRRLPREPRAVASGAPSLPAGHPEGWAEALRDLLRGFYAAIVDGPPPSTGDGPAPYPTLDDGAAVVEAIVESARTETWRIPHLAG